MIHKEGNLGFYLNDYKNTATVREFYPEKDAMGLVSSTHVEVPEQLVVNGKTYIVTTIGHDAFCGQEYLGSITIPKTVERIEDEAFHNCKDLYWVKIAAEKIELGWHAFASCRKLTGFSAHKVVFTATNAFFMCDQLSRLVKTVFADEIPTETFGGCTKLKKVVFADNVVLEESAFKFCGENLTLHFLGNGKIEKTVAYPEPIIKTVIIQCPQTSNLVNKAFDGWHLNVY
jgi:hypothetical protein